MDKIKIIANKNEIVAIADEIRELNGTTDPMGLDAMASNLSDANDEVANQNELIESIVVALEGKAGGGSIPSEYIKPSGTFEVTENGVHDIATYEYVNVNVASSGSTEYETCTVTFDNASLSNDCGIFVVSAMVVEDGIVQCRTSYYRNEDFVYLVNIPNVVCGSTMALVASIYMTVPYVEISGSAIFDSWSVLGVGGTLTGLKFTAPSVANENCTIYFAYNV